MNNKLEQQIENAQQRLEIIQKTAQESSVGDDKLLGEAITEISIALEELTVAVEELHAQNEELLTTRQELELQKQQYQDLFEFAPNAYLVTNVQGKIEKVNQGAANLFQVRRDFLLGKPLSVFISQEDQQKFHSLLNKVGKLDRVRHWQISLKPRNKESFPAEIFVSSIRNFQGKLIGLRWLIQDLSKFKQAEIALRESEAKYRSLFNSIDEGFCIIEMIFDENEKPIDYCFLEVNSSFEEQMGLVAVQGKRMRELAPDLEEHWFEIYGNVALTGEPIRFENVATQLRRWYDVYAFRLGETESRKVAILFKDISDRLHIEKALHRSEEQFRLFVTASSDIVYRMSADWCEMHRLEGKDFLVSTENPSRTWLETYIPPEEQLRVWAAIQSAIRTKSIFELEHRVIQQDGTIGWTFSRAIPMLNQQGEIVEWFGAASDITECKQNEIALQESQNQIQQQLAEIETIYQSAPIGLNVLDLDLRFVRINQTLAEINGLSVEAHLGRTVKEVLPELADAAEQVLQTILETGEPLLNVEIVGETPAQPGVQRTWLESFLPLKDGDRIIGISTVCQEITERKQSELALQQQLSREHLIAEITKSIHQTLNLKQILQTAVEGLRQLLHTDRVIIFRFHPDWSGRVIAESVTAEYLSILESEITDPCFQDQYVEPYCQGRCSAIADFSASDVEPCYQELMAQFHVKANLVVPIVQQEHLWGLVIAHECSAPRQWETENIELLQQLATQLGIAIQQSELYQKIAEQAALIDISSDAIFVRDLDNHIIFWSKGAERLYGWTASEILGQKAHELFQPESLSQLAESLNITLAQGSWQGELQQVKKNGQEIIVASRWTLMKNQDGKPLSILVVNSDITEKKQIEQQFYRAQRLESLGTLASGIAHDLNNIFTPILGITQLLPLKLPELDHKTHELLIMLEENSRRGIKMVQQILTFARGAEGKRIPLQVGYLLNDIAKIARQTFLPSIEIDTEIPTKELWTIQADSTQLHQVFMNLVINARDAMPSGGILTLSADNCSLDATYAGMNPEAHPGKYVVIKISDTGMGIPPAQQEHIFDPFFTTKEVGKGTGLGLSTVLGIVKNHGGFLEVSSEVGKGTQFKVYLPASEQIIIPLSEEKQIPSGNGELILIVDDEATVQQITKTILAEYNYRTLVAGDGLEAIALYAQHKEEISLVLMDLMMPNMDGLTAIGILKKMNPQIQIVAMSGLPTKIDKVSSAGAKEFLAKPYSTKELLDTLSHLLAAQN